MMLSQIQKLLLILWASPNSLLGILVGGLGLLHGGRCRLQDGVLEFHGGFVTWFLRRAPLIDGAAAMALGHVVLGRDRQTLERCGDHERVHVRQYERWGPFFLPAYLGASAYIWMRGGDAYRDNPFEIQAYRETDFN